MKLTDTIQQFIKTNLEKNVNELFLKFDNKSDVNTKFAINQIALRQRIREKLPEIYNNYDLLIPPRLSTEQSSSEITADYKANICNYDISADLTGGMGIDSIFLSKKAKSHYYIEKDEELCEYFEYNSKILNLTNIKIIKDDAENFLKSSEAKFDFIYIDPHRRSEKGNKLYFLDDTVPNVINLLDLLKNLTKKLLIKTSPLLDISKAILELKFVSEVHILSVDNECKELLFLLDFEKIIDIIEYHTVNFTKKSIQKLVFTNNNLLSKLNFGIALPYLYEPNSSIMKSGFFNQISINFNLIKLAENSHLYSSNVLISDFPGRIFEIQNISKYNKKDIQKYCPNKCANISLRNFPDTTENFKKKIGLKDGGDIYIFGSKNSKSELIIFICKKISKG